MQLSFKQVGQALWCALLCSALYFSGFFVLLTPLPLLYLSLRRNQFQWMIAFFPSLGVALFFSQPLFCYYLFVGFLLGLGVWKQWSFGRWGAYVGLSTTALVLLTGFLLHYFGVVDVRGFLQRVIQESQAMLDQVISSPTFHGDRAEVVAVTTEMKKSIELFPRLLPSLVFTFTVFVMILNLGFLRLIYRISKYLVKAGDFKRLQISSACVWVLIAAGSCYFLDYYFLKQGWLKLVALNLLIVAGFIYFIQGVSILAFFLRRYSPLFRFGIYGLVILFFQMVGLVVVGLGLADIWFDFRKLHKQSASKN